MYLHYLYLVEGLGLDIGATFQISTFLVYSHVILSFPPDHEHSSRRTLVACYIRQFPACDP